MFYDWALTRSAQELANRTRNLILPANAAAEVRPEAARFATAPTVERRPGEVRRTRREEAAARALAARDRRRLELTGAGETPSPPIIRP